MGSKAYSFWALGDSGGTSGKPFVPVRLKALVRLVRRSVEVSKDADVLYVHSPEMLLPLVLRRTRLPVVFHMHGAANPLGRSRYRWARFAPVIWAYERLYRVVVRRCDAVITVDAAGLAKCQAMLGKASAGRCFLIPTCFDERVFQVDAATDQWRSASTRNPEKRVIFVGRLEEGKGLDTLLGSFALLYEQRPDVCLTVVGDGTQRARMEAEAEALGIRGVVDFRGWAEPEAIAGMLRASCLYYLPSLAEGLSIAVLEALACGTPVVATSVGDLGSVVRDGVNGFLLSSRSPKDHAEVLSRGLDHAWDREAISASVAHMTSVSVASQVSGVLAFAVRSR